MDDDTDATPVLLALDGKVILRRNETFCPACRQVIPKSRLGQACPHCGARHYVRAIGTSVKPETELHATVKQGGTRTVATRWHAADSEGVADLLSASISA